MGLGLHLLPLLGDGRADLYRDGYVHLLDVASHGFERQLVGVGRGLHMEVLCPVR